MGTRHLTIVKSKGETKVAQYGQWDGYPTGQGDTIAEFLKGADLKKFRNQIKNLKEVTEADRIEMDKKGNDWKKEFPYMSRDTGAGILQMIHDDTVRFVYLDENFKDDGISCEYYYTIDLDKETVSVNGGKEYTFKQWTRKGLMEKLEERDEE